jgi:ATP-dependent Clp protease ATP-binding subunit ClpC
LPESLLQDEVRLEHRAVVETFRQRIIGQDSACERAARLVTTFKAGLNDPNRPLGVLLLCGPTGVGKTELAKTLSGYLFGHGEKTDRLIRLDMSEYSAPGAADRLLLGSGGKPSAWIERVRQHPFSVVLLDEIEKAAPEVFDVFLNVFDEGRLTDRYGRVTIFRSAILLMTSNLGASRHGSLGFGDRPPAFEAEAMSFFRPEFFNRLDDVVTFQPLNEAVVREITRKELGEVAQREGPRKARLRLLWSDPLVNHLTQVGFDRRYGARPLQRAIEREVVASLARFLVDHPTLCDREVAVDLDAEQRVVFTFGN